MKHVMAVLLAGLMLISSQLMCCSITLPELPQININVPTVAVGELQDTREAIPLPDAGSASVDILFGVGDLEIDSGASDQLFSGHFRYNVERWEPEVDYDGDVLTIKQGGTEQDWGIPTGNIRNDWDLEFSPDIPLRMNLDLGAGDGELDFTGLQIEELDLNMGAGDFEVRFDEPNQARMGQLALDTGASKLDVIGIGHAGPDEMIVQGGVGDITLDFTGDWPHSSEARITSGVGSIALRLPDDVGVRVSVEGGLTNVETSGLRRSGDDYVNDAFGEAETELQIELTTGVGSVRLIEVSND